MKKSEKQFNIILKRLDLVNKLSVSDIAELLNISQSSARRISAKMEEQNLAIRIFGGLVKKPTSTQSSVTYDYNAVESINLEQKKKIASKVAQIISQKNSVYLDSGSTLYRISLALSNLLSNTPNQNLKIFTNSLKNLEVLEEHCSIRISGGDYRPSRHDLYGFIAENSISMINFDVCVIGADGVEFNTGLSTTDFDTAKLCMQAMKNSKYKILAVDSSKFNRNSLVTFAQIDDFDLIVTDDKISESTIKKLKQYKVEVIY